MKNAQKLTYTLAENEFADLTEDEMRQRRGVITPEHFLAAFPDAERITRTEDDGCPPPPADLDWEREGKATPVKHQGNCGSCLVFANTGMAESILKIQYDTDILLSE